jgi:hypothetical protein
MRDDEQDLVGVYDSVCNRIKEIEETQETKIQEQLKSQPVEILNKEVNKMTLEKLQELVNNEEIIYVVQDNKIWRIHTQKDYEATTCGLDNGQRLVPFEPENAYETALEAVLAYVKKRNTDIDIKSEIWKK